MCTVSTPPPLTPAWPWQAPGNWLAFAGALAVVAIVTCGTSVVAIRHQPSALRRHVGWVLLLAMALCLVASYFLTLVVAQPARDALLTWATKQNQAIQAQGCSLEVWHPLYEQASRTIGRADYGGNVLFGLGSLLLLLQVGLRFYTLRSDAASARTR